MLYNYKKMEREEFSVANIDWTAIKTEYVTSNIGYRELSKNHKVPFKTLAHRAKQEKWVEMRQRHKDKLVTKAVKKIEDKGVDYKSTLYEIAYNMALQLQSITKDKTIEDLAMLGLKPRDITSAAKDIGEILHIKSDIDLKEQEARIANLRKQAESGDTNKDINIIIAENAEDYSK